MSLQTLLLENWFVIVFYSIVFLLVYLNRNRFQKEGIAYLLKTNLGLKWMNKLSKKHRKAVKRYGYIAIVFAYIGIVVFMFSLVPLVKDVFVGKAPAEGTGIPLPGLKIKGIGRIPLIGGWIGLILIMVVHEFSHGVVARAHKEKVKSSGVGFVGPLPVAFVELDEKALAKRKHSVQHSVFAAGPFANILLTVVCALFFYGMIYSVGALTYNEGIVINTMQNESLPAYSAGLPESFVLTGINNQNITSISQLNSALDQVEPYENITIQTTEGSYNLTTTVHPNTESQGYLGIYLIGEKTTAKKDSYNPLLSVLAWLTLFFFWTGTLSLNIGLFNIFPIFITDGAKMLKLNIEFLVKDEKKAFEIWKYVNYVGLFVVGILLVNLFYNFIISLF